MSETSKQIFAGEFAGPRDRARISAQIERIRAWSLARDWFTIREARESLERLYTPTLFPENSIQAQLRNLEKLGAGRLRCTKEKRYRGGGLWEYRLHAVPEIAAPPAKLTSEDPPLERIIRWPATFEQLEGAGYGYTGTGKRCPRCRAHFLWFITPAPARRWMPFSALEDDRLMPHSAVCQRAQAISVRLQRAARTRDTQPPQAQASLNFDRG